MKIAVPVSGGKATDLRRCKEFAIMNVDPISRSVIDQTVETPPQEGPAYLPDWLSERGANVVIACDVIPQTLAFLAAAGIEVLIGAPAQDAAELANLYLGTMVVV